MSGRRPDGQPHCPALRHLSGTMVDKVIHDIRSHSQPPPATTVKMVVKAVMIPATAAEPFGSDGGCASGTLLHQCDFLALGFACAAAIAASQSCATGAYNGKTA